MKKAIVTVDLGFGDSCKGATVDFLCRKYRPDLVIRYSGGSQCGHNVVLPNGTHHMFAQLTSGSFAGVPGYLDRAVIVDPISLAREAEHFRSLGFNYKLTVNPECLLTNQIYQLYNQGDIDNCQHGTCGMGIGITRETWLSCGEAVPKVKDLNNLSSLTEKLYFIQHKLLTKLYESDDGFWNGINKINVKKLAMDMIDKKHYFSIGDMPEHNFAIYEAAQGVLLDEFYGFHPHTTWSSTTDFHVNKDMYDKVFTLGITRAYHTRHGNGPLPSYDEDFSNKVNVEHNPYNPWQGSFRSGWLDINLLKYALSVNPVDGVAVNCIDELPQNPKVFIGYHSVSTTDYSKYSPLKKIQQRKNTYLENNGGVLEDLDPVEEINKLSPIKIWGHGRTYKERKSCKII